MAHMWRPCRDLVWGAHLYHPVSRLLLLILVRLERSALLDCVVHEGRIFHHSLRIPRICAPAPAATEAGAPGYIGVRVSFNGFFFFLVHPVLPLSGLLVRKLGTFRTNGKPRHQRGGAWRS